MIWVIQAKEDEEYGIPTVFRYYREVVGKENIKLVTVNEDEEYDFVNKENDVILLRTFNKQIIKRIKEKGFNSTAEELSVYEKVNDKKELGKFLQEKGIKVPKQYNKEEIKKQKTYFVKPRFGGESFGIIEDCICKTPNDVFEQIERIKKELNQESIIEEYIDGVDCTVAIVRNTASQELITYAIKIENDVKGGIQTHDSKFGYDEYCSILSEEETRKVCNVTKEIFKILKMKHMARIDYRMSKNGEFYMIDINSMPGLGPSAHFAKSCLLTKNLSYKDMIYQIINSSSN